MDIALHYFDEYVGDALYAKLDNPFAKAASPLLTSLGSNFTASPPLSSSPITNLLASIPSLSSLPRDSAVRQALSLYGIVYVGILLVRRPPSRLSNRPRAHWLITSVRCRCTSA